MVMGLCGLTRMLCGIACVVALPATAWAQASIAGTARDSSGAVLPGVTVEASSSVLIEKTRSVVTDGSGQYRDCRPAAGDLYRHVHAPGLLHGPARRHRAHRVIYRHRQR